MEPSIDQLFQSAIAHHSAGRLAQAEPLYRAILARQADHADALHRLGFLAHQVGKPELGLEMIRRSIALRPVAAHYHNNLGEILRAMGQIDPAIAAYRQALALQPNDPIACNNLGTALAGTGDHAAALPWFQKAVALRSGYVNALSNLGNALSNLGRVDEALEAFRKALAIAPQSASVQNNLALVYRQQGKMDDAVACCRKAVAQQPDYADAWNNLGSILKGQGRIVEAVQCLHKAAMLQPNDPLALSTYLLLLPYDPATTPQKLFDEHVAWGRKFADPFLSSIQPHHNDRTSMRRLRIGYCSPNFRGHALGYYLLPILRRQDHSQFEIFCYSDVSKPDRLTERFRPCADVWRETAALPDAQLADLIRKDRIDILIDLTLHMARNRLHVFARKPSPVQATYLAFPGTSGMRQMDYLISDPHIDPPGKTEAFHTETIIRLPHSFWCFEPAGPTPDVNPLPADTAGFITFGSLNNAAKINAHVIALWRKILQAVPRSRLHLLIQGGAAGNASVMAEFQKGGIDSSRLSIHSMLPPEQYLQLYHQIDIGLDPFPVNGHTTSIDSFWMGVPVITLAGEQALGRAGLCLLTNLGLSALITDTPENYEQTAVSLANDLPRLRELRETLRARLPASPIMNAEQFTRDLEGLYRQMWKTWTEQTHDQPIGAPLSPTPAS